MNAIPDPQQDGNRARVKVSGTDTERILEELLVLGRQQALSSSDAFKHIVEQLQRQADELRRAIALASPESAEHRIALASLSENWLALSDKWVKFATAPKIEESGVLEQQEGGELHRAILDLQRTISALLYQTDRQRQPRGYVTRELIDSVAALRVRLPMHATHGGAAEPPHLPPEAAAKASDEEP